MRLINVGASEEAEKEHRKRGYISFSAYDGVTS